MLQLVIPDISHKEQWEEVMREWGDDWRKNPRICFQNSYEELLTLLRNVQYNDDVNLMIPQSSVYFLFDDSVLVGMYWLRHNLKYHDDTLYGGHIGYGIRPSKRKNGYGKEGLALVLGEAKKIGLSKVYLSCDDENIGSVKIIEANGGILEKVFEKVFKEGIIPKRRYWIDLYKKEKETLTSLELITPNISHKEQWEEIILEWGDFQRRPRIFFQDTFDDFLQNTERLSQGDDLERQISKTSIFFLIDTETNRILGFFWLRHHLTFRDDIQYGGHIGYGIRPTERGKGYAKEGLGLTLMEAKKISIDRVFISCDDENIASAKVIEANGGILESYNYAPDGTKRRRYWINLE